MERILFLSTILRSDSLDIYECVVSAGKDTHVFLCISKQ